MDNRLSSYNSLRLNYLFVYGTLKIGGEPRQYISGYGINEFLGKHHLDGYTMYNLRFYPGVISNSTRKLYTGKDNDGHIIGELHHVTNRYLEYVTNMEILAGYKVEKVMVNNIETSIFVYTRYLDCLVKRKPIIEWDQYYNGFNY